AVQADVRRVADGLENICGLHPMVSVAGWVLTLKSLARRSSGNSQDHAKTTAMAPTPPAMTAATGPINAPRNPLSASPSSFEAEMKSEETEPTRPRISSGVESWISDWRT